MRRRISLLAAALVVAGAGAVFFLRHTAAPAAPVLVTPSVATTKVKRGDLADSRLVAGTLGYGTPSEVRGSGPGVLTRLPKPGTTLRRGAELFRVDDQPVVVLYGDTPMFRAIDKAGLAGNDVLELRRNLDALGYWSRAARYDTVDQPLLDQLKKWQQRLGVTAPGALRPGQVVVVPGSARVSEVVAELGTPADDVVLKTTGKAKVVTVAMTADDARTVKLGAKVTLVLPDGHETAARVSAISHSIVAGTDSTEPPKLTVTITPGTAVGSFDTAPVQVRFTTAARSNVLVVPVTALVALREGGYAVQLPGGGLVAATTGAFAGGLVEVSGAGITAGLTVVTAQ